MAEEENIIKTIPLKSWSDWEAFVSSLPKEEKTLRNKAEMGVSDLLFRGQRCASWGLKSTLERNKIEFLTMEEFSKEIKTTKRAFESCFGVNWPTETRSVITDIPSPPEEYEFMVYLRHHGYPTPLLDWSRSPYIAAFFAFQYPCETDDKVAIYSYREYTGGVKTGCSSDSTIITTGPTIRTHKRHYLQQAEYTYCRKEMKALHGSTEKMDKREIWDYSSHEEAFEKTGDEQDILHKYTIPADLRSEVLAKLDSMNINAYTLYDSEEGLAEMLANRKYKYQS